MKAASGVKRFIMSRLARVHRVLSLDGRDDTRPKQETYRVEADGKYADFWEETCHQWIRHHKVSRKVFSTPCGTSTGPDVESLRDDRVTEIEYPNGTTERVTTNWRCPDQQYAEPPVPGYWRGKTIFDKKTPDLTGDKKPLYGC